MKDQYKNLRIWLQDWGSWKRKPVHEIDSRIGQYDAGIHLSYPEPSYWSNTEAFRTRHVTSKHMRQTATVPAYRPAPPRYWVHTRMSQIDRIILQLPKALNIVINQHYEQELKPREISRQENTTEMYIYRKLNRAYKKIIKLLRDA